MLQCLLARDAIHFLDIFKRFWTKGHMTSSSTHGTHGPDA
jgi:hypothetical protein